VSIDFITPKYQGESMSLPWPPAEQQAGTNGWRLKEEWIKFEAAVVAADMHAVVQYFPRRRGSSSGTKALLSSPYWPMKPTAEDREVDRVEDHGSSASVGDSDGDSGEAPMDLGQDDGDANQDDSDSDFEIIEPKSKEEKKEGKMESKEERKEPKVKSKSEKKDEKQEKAAKPKAEAKRRSQSRGRDARSRSKSRPRLHRSRSRGPPASADPFDRAAAAAKEKADAEAKDKLLGSIGNDFSDPSLRKSGSLSSQPLASEESSLPPMLPLPPLPAVLQHPIAGALSSSSGKADGKSPIRNKSSDKADGKLQVTLWLVRGFCSPRLMASVLLDQADRCSRCCETREREAIRRCAECKIHEPEQNREGSEQARSRSRGHHRATEPASGAKLKAESRDGEDPP